MVSDQHPATDTISAWPGTSTRDLISIGFAILFPTFVTLIYFVLLKDADPKWQKTAYGIGKTIQFGFPVGWLWLFYREKLYQLYQQHRSDSRSDKAHWTMGIAFGLLVVLAMFGIYYGFIAGQEIGSNLQSMVQEKVSGFAIDRAWKYIGLGLFYALIHSFLEEYYWRWFVFDYLLGSVGPWMANLISSLGFAFHHVILLAFFFGWNEPLTYVFSLCIAVGGLFWAWQFRSTSRLAIPWVSHMIVDAGIFALGYGMVRELF